jgi:hypothetical protein
MRAHRLSMDMVLGYHQIRKGRNKEVFEITVACTNFFRCNERFHPSFVACHDASPRRNVLTTDATVPTRPRLLTDIFFAQTFEVSLVS